MSTAKKVSVLTDKAPKPLPGIYSQAIVAGGFVYCSGAVPMDADTGKLIDGDVQAHTVSTHVLSRTYSLTASNNFKSTNASRT
jgi:enamine deaminase RidA (YjgF/YER057c/UK114 family)